MAKERQDHEKGQKDPKPGADRPDAAEQRPKSDADYIRVLSHQLKSPISAIQTMLAAIRDGYAGEVEPKALQFVLKSIARTEEARDIITDLLDFELYSGEEVHEKAELDLIRLLDDLYTRYTPVASEKNISLSYDFPMDQRVVVMGNYRALEHAIRNIIDNAIKYTPQDGKVAIRYRRLDDGRCRIAVSDSGYGIPEAELESIFEPFFRSLKHKSHIPGTGLGLAIARRIVKQHGGEISVDSRPGEGTTFTLTIPLVRTEKAESEATRSKRVVIIGGVTAGPKAAARLRRLDERCDITIIEKSEFLSYAGCGLPYYISGGIRSPKALMSTADNTVRDVHFFEAIKNIKILNKTLAEEIDRKKKLVRIKDLESGEKAWLPYDTLVLATGAQSIAPDIPGIREPGVFSLHNFEDAEAIKSHLTGRNAKDVIIIGGGLIGIETAESLIEAGARVTILEKREHVLLSLMDPDISTKIEHELNAKGIKILGGTEIRRIQRRHGQLILTTGAGELGADLIILSAGVKPNSELADRAGLKLGRNGGVKVNPFLQSSDKDIYAIGDCAETVNIITGKHEYWPLGSISTKMGRIAADNICGKRGEFAGFIATAMFRIFDINVARTGLTLRETEENGFHVETALITGMDRPHYTGNARFIVLKILADSESRRILGAQGYGKGDLSSRISTLACAITNGMTLEKVFKLDLGYHPAYNNPIDTVQTACLVLENKIDRLMRTMSLEELERLEGAVNLIDVSPLPEHDAGSIPGSVNVPLEAVRREEIPFPKDAKIVLYSRTSSGAYEAYRYLASRGYENLFVLEGGYIYWER